MLVSLLIVLLMVVGIALVAAAMLALGTLLAHVFAVSTFEASLIVLVVAVGWVLLLRAPPLEADDEQMVGVADEEPALVFRAVPLPTRRSPRRRKR